MAGADDGWRWMIDVDGNKEDCYVDAEGSDCHAARYNIRCSMMLCAM